MKRPTFCGVVVCVIVTGMHVGIAQEGKHDQEVDLDKMKSTFEWLQQPCSLEFVDHPLQDILATFKRRDSWLSFDWETEAHPKTKITIEVDGKPMGEALQQMLDQSNWTYALKPDGRILLRPIPSRKGQGMSFRLKPDAANRSRPLSRVTVCNSDGTDLVS